VEEGEHEKEGKNNRNHITCVGEKKKQQENGFKETGTEGRNVKIYHKQRTEGERNKSKKEKSQGIRFS